MNFRNQNKCKIINFSNCFTFQDKDSLLFTSTWITNSDKNISDNGLQLHPQKIMITSSATNSSIFTSSSISRSSSSIYDK